MSPDVDIRAMEKADRVPIGAYQRLIDAGSLVIDYGREIPRPAPIDILS